MGLGCVQIAEEGAIRLVHNGRDKAVASRRVHRERMGKSQQQSVEEKAEKMAIRARNQA